MAEEIPVTLCKIVCANGEVAEWWIKGDREPSVFMYKDTPPLLVLGALVRVTEKAWEAKVAAEREAGK